MLSFALLQAEAALSEKRASYESDVAAFAGTKQEYDTAINDLAKTEELLQTLITGLGASSNEDGEAAGGYMGQLADAKALMASAASEAEQAKMKIGLLEREIKEKEPRAKKAARMARALRKNTRQPKRSWKLSVHLSARWIGMRIERGSCRADVQSSTSV